MNCYQSLSSSFSHAGESERAIVPIFAGGIALRDFRRFEENCRRCQTLILPRPVHPSLPIIIVEG